MRAAARTARSGPVAGDRVLGPTWQQLFARSRAAVARRAAWWRAKRAAAAEALRRRRPPSSRPRGGARRGAVCAQLSAISRVHYSMKAKPARARSSRRCAPRVEFECVVARGDRAAACRPSRTSSRSASCTRRTSPRARNSTGRCKAGVRVSRSTTPTCFRQLAAAAFAGRDIFVRHRHRASAAVTIDHVRTAGTRSKFGVQLSEAARARRTGAGGRRAHRRTAGARRQRHLRCYESGSTPRGCWPARQGFRGSAGDRCGRQAWGCRSGPIQPGLDLAKLDTLLLAVRAEREAEYGSNLGATASPPPAYCSRASRS